MNKVWFVFIGQHHIGPFSKEEVHELYLKGEVKDSSLVWKEGHKDWQPLFKTEEFLFIFETPIKSFSVDELSTQDDFPPPLPVEVFKKPEVKKLPVQKPIHKVAKESEKPPVQVEKQSKAKGIFNKFELSKSISIVVLACLVGILSVALYMVLGHKSDKHKFRNILPSKVVYLLQILEDSDSKIKLAQATTMDGKYLYFATNSKHVDEIDIQYTSDATQNLKLKNLNFNLKVKIDKSVGKFNLELGRVMDLASGQFKYQAVVYKRHFMLSYFPIFERLNLFSARSQEIISGEDHLYSGSIKEYDLKYKKLKQIDFEERTRDIQEKMERLVSFKSLLDQLLLKHTSAIKAAKNVTEALHFEKFYLKEFAPLLQAFLLKDDEAYAPINNSIIKKIGELCYNQIEMIKKTSILGPRTKHTYATEFNFEVVRMKNEVDELRIKMQEELDAQK